MKKRFSVQVSRYYGGDIGMHSYSEHETMAQAKASAGAFARKFPKDEVLIYDSKTKRLTTVRAMPKRNPAGGRDRYEVIVGNIGSVYSGNNKADALGKFSVYKGQSIGNYGRAAGEDVTVMRDGEPWMEHFGSLGREENPLGGIKAQVRRLPSGQVQLKVPLKKGENPLAKAQQLAKALGRKITSVTRVGNPSSDLQFRGDIPWNRAELSRLLPVGTSVIWKGHYGDPDFKGKVVGYNLKSIQGPVVVKLASGTIAEIEPAELRISRGNPIPITKSAGGYYRVGDFWIHKAFIPMPKGQGYSLYTREGQVVGRAASLKAAIALAQRYVDRGVVIENPRRGKANPGKAYWQHPWVVLIKSQSTGEADGRLSQGFSTEGKARLYMAKLVTRSLHRGRTLELLHNTGTNVPGGVKSVSSRSY